MCDNALAMSAINLHSLNSKNLRFFLLYFKNKAIFVRIKCLKFEHKFNLFKSGL